MVVQQRQKTQSEYGASAAIRRTPKMRPRFDDPFAEYQPRSQLSSRSKYFNRVRTQLEEITGPVSPRAPRANRDTRRTFRRKFRASFGRGGGQKQRDKPKRPYPVPTDPINLPGLDPDIPSDVDIPSPWTPLIPDIPIEDQPVPTPEVPEEESPKELEEPPTGFPPGTCTDDPQVAILLGLPLCSRTHGQIQISASL